MSTAERVVAVRTDRARPPEATEPERLGLAYRPALDGLRAVAVLAVFGYHFTRTGTRWIVPLLFAELAEVGALPSSMR